MKPLVSVIVTVYNGQDYLLECLNSILNQTYKSFELIVVDDASTDSTGSILSTIKDKRLLIHTNKSNSGPFVSANTGISLSKGKYIARIDADDVSDSTRFEKQVEFLESTGYTLVGSNLTLINEKGDVIGTIINPETHEDNVGNIIFVNSIAHSSAMFLRDFVLNIGGYSTEYNKAQDYELWLKIIEAGGKVHNLQEFLIQYRVHSQSITTQHRTRQEEIAGFIIKKYVKKLLDIDISETQIDLLRNRVGKQGFWGNRNTLKFLIELNHAFIQHFPDLKHAQKIFYSNSASILKDAKLRNLFILRYAKEF